MDKETKKLNDNQRPGVPFDPVVIFRSGLFDKNGREICLGDIIELHIPYRSSQTHYGDNIPRPCGSYTELLEPEIKTERHEVKWGKGMFYITTYKTESDEVPNALFYDLIDYKTSEELKQAFGGAPNWSDTENSDECDLDYLLEYYQPNTEDELMNFVSGCEVVEI